MKKIFKILLLLLAVFSISACKNNQNGGEVNFNENLKVLAVENSFSEDALAYLYNIADDYGVKNIVLGNLYIGGSELSHHVNNIKNENSNYTYQKNVAGGWEQQSGKSLLFGLLDEDWDIITVQQASGKSGQSSYYDPYLKELITFIEANKTNKNAKIYWHLTWAYQANSSHAEFSSYQLNQLTMYNEIINTYNTSVKIHDEIKGVIPAGTSIQNVRTNYIGDTITRDGYHLSNSVGRLTAGLTWFKTITGLSIDNISYRPAGVSDDDLVAIKESVNNAFNKPLEITNSSYKEKKEIDLNDYELLELNWVIGYYFAISSHQIYNESGNSKYFTTHTNRLSRTDIPIGSIIQLENGYQYRIDYFMNLDGDVSKNLRSAEITYSEIIVDESMWQSYQYVAFSLSHVGGKTDITDTYLEVASKLKIFVPKK